jgi:cyclopropane-fatty-acyl-phospholipid synthase
MAFVPPRPASTFPGAAGRTPGAERPLPELDRRLFAILHSSLKDCPIRLRFRDGADLPPSHGPATTTVAIQDRLTLLKLLWDPERHFGDAYVDGRITVEGDLFALLEPIFHSWKDTPGGRFRLALARLARFGSSRDDIHHHYDIGNDFYRLWLDSQLVYTCAYFPTPTATLDEAQEAKLDLVCRKLGLRPGERVVEAGCGWGALALHMARRHGVTVKAYNISREQVRYARQAAATAGLAHRVEFIEDDFREMRGPADAFVSVGMIEHAGRGRYRAFGEVIDRCLDRGHGRGLLHFIGRTRRRPLNPWTGRRIFPGAYPPTLAEVTEQVLAPRGLSVLDVENLRLHYAKTLEHWRTRFEAAAGTIEEMFDARFVRTWRLYLAASQASFATSFLQLYQVTFARGRNNGIPWTRAQLYTRDGNDGAL